MKYFALIVPPSTSAEDPPGNIGDTGQETSAKNKNVMVLESKEEALKLLKLHKQSRLKTFGTREEAEAFVLQETIQTDPDNSESSSNETKKDNVTGEGCPFPSLKPQELKMLKEAIKEQDEAEVDRLVDSNPRYLVTTCDKPSVLHSGTRANALHFAAMSGSVKMVEKILNKIQDPDLLARMYPGDTPESRSKRLEHLLDLYLNCPNKGTNDTPLHQASKAGFVDIVRFLVSFSSCDTSRQNREGKTPAEVACAKYSGSALDEDVKREIEQALCGQHYIPVIRDNNFVAPSYLGQPWSPRMLVENNECYDSSSSSHFNPMVLLSPMPKRSFNLTSSPSSPIISSSPLTVSDDRSPLMARALLGPLSPQDALAVLKEWKSSLSKEDKLKDPVKGIERKGRGLAQKLNLNLFEFWEFLGAYCDLTKPEGLVMLDNYLCDVRKSLEKKARQQTQKEMDDLDQEYSSGGAITTSNVLSPVSQLINDLEDFHVTSPKNTDTEHHDSADQKEKEDFQINVLPTLESQTSHNESFKSIGSSVSQSSFETADEGLWVYINGSTPSIDDLQVFEVLKDVSIDSVQYPEVYQWRDLVSLASEEERAIWGKPASKASKRKLLNIPKLTFE